MKANLLSDQKVSGACEVELPISSLPNDSSSNRTIWKRPPELAEVIVPEKGIWLGG
jgi:hypothetical protein